MTDDAQATPEGEFEYDVAFSLAGEDTGYVRPIAQRLRDVGVKVFYYEFDEAESWGADLPVFFDEIFRKTSRYAVLFISRYYVGKVWPRFERQSAQARALFQTSPYILPVLLDDSELPGLRPTVGYVDARITGRDRLIELIREKIAGTPQIDRVPRTAAEEAALLSARPDGWEFLLFAAVLLRARDALEPKWRDHELRVGRKVRPALNFDQAQEMIVGIFAQASTIGDNFERLFDEEVKERAFGKLGEPGDPVRIEHLAQRIVGVYDDFLEWEATLRETPVPESWRPVVEIAVRFVEGPLRQVREFVDVSVAELDQLPAKLRDPDGPPITTRIAVSLDIDDGVTREFRQACDELVERRLREIEDQIDGLTD